MPITHRVVLAVTTLLPGAPALASAEEACTLRRSIFYSQQ